MNNDAYRRSNLPKLTFNETEADQITGTSRQTRWRARRRGELQSVETIGRSVRYTLDMLTQWLNGQRKNRKRKRKGSH